jgi:S1-C subfamily serine protease
MKKATLILCAGLLVLPAFLLGAQQDLIDAFQAQVESVYTKAAPSVVNITSTMTSYNYFNQPIPQEGTGSGFVYDAQGHIVTNFHVVENAESISVKLQDGRTFPASVVGTDSSNDLAVIKVSADRLPPPLQIVDSQQLKVGQFVVALGNPFGLQSTLTFGVISALGRSIQSPDGRFIGEAIQTDTPINPGNSGGPLLDLQARVVGINSQIISPSGTSSGIGFAVSSNTVMRVAPQLVTKGRYSHTYLGVHGVDMSPDLAKALRSAGVQVSAETGFLVIQVDPNSPAAKAGIKGGATVVQYGNMQLPVGGDILVALNGKSINSYEMLTVYLETNTKIGDVVTVTIFRGGKKTDLKVTLAERPL